jgi:tetratricopeptide (TPR) repeat protein
MKTKFINQFLSVAFLLLLLGSCAKDDEFYQLDKPAVFPYYSIDKMEAAAVSMYAVTTDGWWYHPIAANWMILNPAGDDHRWLALNTSNVDHVHLFFRNQATTANGDCQQVWQGAYKSIGNINSVLDFYEANNGTPFLGKDGITDSYKKNVLRIKGEALFLRAYNYSLMVPIFTPWYVIGGANSDKILPLKLHYPSTYAETQPVLGTTQQIYDQMITDLKGAIELLPKIYDGSFNQLTQVARVNQYVARGLLARIYFWMGRYTEAQEQLDLILNDSALPYNLSKDPVTSWNQESLITTANAPNVMWNNPVFQTDNPGGWWVMTTFIPWSPWGSPSWKEYPLAHSMAKKFGWIKDDLSETPEALLDKRYTQLCVRFLPKPSNGQMDPTKQYEPVYSSAQVPAPEIWVDKFFHVPGHVERMSVPLMKLSEMILTRSILRFNKGDKTGALNDLNRVRNYAGIGDFPGGAGALTADAIHTERAKEMLWEADRYLYLKSLRLDVPPGDRLDVDKSNSYKNNTEKAPYNYYWPVPQVETDFYTTK